MVRDPAAIILSPFSLNCYHFQHDIVRMVNENNEADLIQDRIDRLFRQEQNCLFEKTAGWFDDELLRVFSINIFDSEFPIQKGYQIYKNDRLKVLLIRLEDLNRCYREAFDEFLGIQADNIRRDNSAENLGYSELYRHIRQTVRFSGDYLQNLYEITRLRHCYSLQEIEDFKNQWV